MIEEEISSHPNGADVPGWALVLLVAFLAAPFIGAFFLIGELS